MFSSACRIKENKTYLKKKDFYFKLPEFCIGSDYSIARTGLLHHLGLLHLPNKLHHFQNNY